MTAKAADRLARGNFCPWDIWLCPTSAVNVHFTWDKQAEASRTPRLYWGIPLSYVDCTSASGVGISEGFDPGELHMQNWPETSAKPQHFPIMGGFSP
jgi:hypothetical protein